MQISNTYYIIKYFIYILQYIVQQPCPLLKPIKTIEMFMAENCENFDCKICHNCQIYTM